MTRDEAIRAVIFPDPYDYSGMNEKYNNWDFLCGVKDGIPDPEGTEWHGQVESVYGQSLGVTFTPIKDVLDELWTHVELDHLEDEDEYAEAWVVLGYDVKAALR